MPDTELSPDGTTIYYEQPSAEVVKKYSSENYPEWIRTCRSLFETLHENCLEPETDVILTFGIRNNGTRPAPNMRVSFKAVGDVHFCGFEAEMDEVEEQREDEAPVKSDPISQLPKPPVAPEVRRIITQPTPVSNGVDIAALKAPVINIANSELEKAKLAIMGSLATNKLDMLNVQSTFDNVYDKGALSGLPRGVGPMSEILKIAHRNAFGHKSLIDSITVTRPKTMDHLSIQEFPTPEKHNPEAFYYEKWPDGKPIKNSSLKCDRFRHQVDEELFDIYVMFPDEGDVSGAIRCTVVAENLTIPKELLVSVSLKVEY